MGLGQAEVRLSHWYDVPQHRMFTPQHRIFDVRSRIFALQHAIVVMSQPAKRRKVRNCRRPRARGYAAYDGLRWSRINSASYIPMSSSKSAAAVFNCVSRARCICNHAVVKFVPCPRSLSNECWAVARVESRSLLSMAAPSCNSSAGGCFSGHCSHGVTRRSSLFVTCTALQVPRSDRRAV